jgi:hypothetical protein
LIVEIGSAAELRVVRVDCKRLSPASDIILIVEQIAISVNQRGAIELQRSSPMQLFRLASRDVRDLGHCVFVLAIRLAALNVLKTSKQRGTVAVELAF